MEALKTFYGLAAAALLASGTTAQAENWSSTEFHLQHGDISKAFQGGGSGAEADGTTILTLQHAGGWKYGQNFFFFDYTSFGQTDVEIASGATDDDALYGEWYSTFSLGALTGKEIKFGPVKDIGLIAGFNFATEVDTVYYLPGVRFALDLPGFAFANIDITGYIQDNPNRFGVDEDSSFMVDFNWAYPFKIGNTSWSLQGHIEYIDGADTNFGQRFSWILAQPQLRLDLGELIGKKAGQLYVGVEYQFWDNKLGDANTDESVAQFLAVWHF